MAFDSASWLSSSFASGRRSDFIFQILIFSLSFELLSFVNINSFVDVNKADRAYTVKS